MRQRPSKRLKTSRKAPQSRLLPTHRILVIGDGNLSFSAAVSRQLAWRTLHVHKNLLPSLVATTFDACSTLFQKYKDARSHVGLLQASASCLLLFEVDARAMQKTAALQNKLFDRIVFNFPYSGSADITSNRNLLDERHR